MKQGVLAKQLLSFLMGLSKKRLAGVALVQTLVATTKSWT